MTVWTSKLTASKLSGSDYANARLRGTVWERVDLAKAFYGALTTAGGVLGKLHISPNVLTLVSLAIAGAAGGFVLVGEFGLGAALMIASGLCDVLDGAVARATNKVSRFGALLDSTVDRVADALPLVGLMVYFASQPLAAAVPTLALVAGFIVPYVRARAEALGVVLPPLFMRRAERMVLLVLSLLLGTLPLAGILPKMLMLAGVLVMGALSFWGAVSALRAAYSALEKRHESGPRESHPPVSAPHATASGQ
jgi:CDP-diacylglycerol--glycerol-3-phosphate 3-phosphatidyltransferase